MKGTPSALAADLQAVVTGEVRFDDGSRALYATDGSNYRQVPIGVVLPRTTEDVVATVRVCREHGAPITSRGGGTSLAGQCCNTSVVIDMSKYMNRVLELSPTKRFARVEPGTVLDDLRDQAEKHHLTFPPDPSTHNHCTLGGMIGNNSCGVHSVMGGKTSDNILTLDVLTYDGLRMTVGETPDEELASIINAGGRRGEIYLRLKTLRDKYASLIRARFPDIPRLVSGYGLQHLLPENGFHVARALVGTEGTCITVLEAKTRLVYSPPARSLLVLGYPSVYEAARHVGEVLACGPIGLEGLDDILVNDMKTKGLHPERVKILPDGKGWLLCEFGGETKKEADDKATQLMNQLKQLTAPPVMKLFDDPHEEWIIWKVRESGLGATANVPGKPLTWEGWEDAAVPPAKLSPYLQEFRQLLDRFGYGCALYGHFGQGCVHTRIDFDFVTKKGIETYRAFITEAAELVVKYGGSLSGEHGDGQSRAEMLPKMFGPELIRAFEEFKAIWDPDEKMNPGKVVHPYRIDENLRLGTNYDPPQPKTHFSFPADNHSFARAALRCVGVGECRRHGGGVMCPSYMVTREEKHSTRGRAHLLFEMLQGEVIKGGWREESVKEALDLCLACKGCKGDCPVNVDMATYKAEFLSHYYRGRIRPMSAFSMGLIHRWARIGGHAPRMANMLTQTRGLRDVMKRLGGLAPERDLPPFAREPFKVWFKRRAPHNQDRPKVVLWPDTFNNYFHPEVAQAAVEVIEKAGFQVVVPEASLCCGRPLYDFGMLKTAKKLLENILEALRKPLAQGIPVIGLEPSCTAVFRDELKGLFPSRMAAQRMAGQTYILSEFLAKFAPDLSLTGLTGSEAIVHGHCHHRSVIGLDAEKKLLERMGLRLNFPDPGCCGMAGSFGFEQQHSDMARRIGENRLLPAIREAPEKTLIIANGFSCREQIVQGTQRDVLHLAQVAQRALSSGAREDETHWRRSA